MALAPQTLRLIKVASQLYDAMSADAFLLLTETDLDWDEMRELLPLNKLLVVAHDGELTKKLQSYPELMVLDIDPGPTPKRERLSLALLEAVAQDKLRTGAHVVALYNGIEVEEQRPEQIDTISVIHLGEHLERLTAQ